MGKVYDEITRELAAWIERQQLFFVATAPLDADGHVNVSPKGSLEWFRILGPQEVAYADFVGSGAETIAHVRENGRIVLMFCAFEGPPKIVRLHGRGEIVFRDDDAFVGLARSFALPEHGVRSIVRVHVERIADSCGYTVPLMTHAGERPQYDAWLDRKTRDGALSDYVAQKNGTSIDGLPAVSA